MPFMPERRRQWKLAIKFEAKLKPIQFFEFPFWPINRCICK